MSAQPGKDPSMEDILASIRKIIADDNNQDPPGSLRNGGATQLKNDRQDTSGNALNRRPAIDQAAPRDPQPGMDTGRQIPSRSQTPSTLADRQTQPSRAPSDSATAPASLSGAARPASLSNLGNSTQRAAGHSHQSHAGAERQPAPLQASEPADNAEKYARLNTTGRDIPVFEDTQVTPNTPDTPDTPSTLDTPNTLETGAEAPLHPAIENAKAFVSKQGLTNRNNSSSEMRRQPTEERPVFAENTLHGTAPEERPMASEPVEPLVSPESTERRVDEDRRNAPLRRKSDRDDSEFKNALMSPKSSEVVADAFDKLKASATEDIDDRVDALLRPMLREWLDNNLPAMVERLVRDEIERVSRGG